VNGSGKRTSLLQYDNNYDRKKFYGTGSAGLVSEHCRSFFLAANLPTYAKLVRTLFFYFTFCCRSFKNPFFTITSYESKITIVTVFLIAI
jgi:hypothetical protein